MSQLSVEIQVYMISIPGVIHLQEHWTTTSLTGRRPCFTLAHDAYSRMRIPMEGQLTVCLYLSPLPLSILSSCQCSSLLPGLPDALVAAAVDILEIINCLDTSPILTPSLDSSSVITLARLYLTYALPMVEIGKLGLEQHGGGEESREIFRSWNHSQSSVFVQFDTYLP